MKLLYATVALVVVALVVPGQAHHSFSAAYDGNRPIAVRGKISKLGWANPHTHFYVDVVNQKGQTQTWEVETASTIALSRAGMNRDEFVGKEVAVRGFLARDGTTTMVATTFTLVESKKEFTSDEVAPAAE
jgi:hypothetical protein